jgi:hypothetical protein
MLKVVSLQTFKAGLSEIYFLFTQCFVALFSRFCLVRQGTSCASLPSRASVIRQSYPQAGRLPVDNSVSCGIGFEFIFGAIRRDRNPLINFG